MTPSDNESVKPRKDLRAANCASNNVKPTHRGEIPVGRTVDECLEEYSPRAQAFADARRREVLRALDVEQDMAALRKSASRPQRTLDPRKRFIETFVARHPGVTGRALAIALDNSELRPLAQWIRTTGKRLWRELWDDKAHPKTRRAVRKFIYSVAKLSPVVTGDSSSRTRVRA